MAEVIRNQIGFGDFMTVTVYGDDVTKLLTRVEATNTGPADRVDVKITIPTKVFEFSVRLKTETRSWNIPQQYRDVQGTLEAVFLG